MKKMRIFASAAVLLLTAAFTSPALAESQKVDVYVVQRGDTLSQIASRYHVSLSTLEQANPNISNPNLIFPGEQITVPESGEPQGQSEPGENQPLISVSPHSGVTGTQFQVTLSGFPANTPVALGFGNLGAASQVVATTQTDANGAAVEQMSVPSTASPGSWIVVAATTQGSPVEASSTLITISQSAPAPNQTNYIVQPGDELSVLAKQYGTSVSAILAANPQITNPNRIYVGERILIPGKQQTGPEVVVSPQTGPTGTQVMLSIGDFPANTPVQINAKVNGNKTSYKIASDKTDANGSLDLHVVIPSSSQVNDAWVFTVKTTSGQTVSATSNTFTVTSSENNG
ncbi:MAG: LysM peptidoglycan-binding domain-containing protein [Anaerolineales bacterium]